MFPLQFSFQVREGPNCRVIRLSASYLADPSLIDKAVLLCENLTDTHLYMHPSEAYLHWSNIGHITLRYDPRLGGGQTTSNVYESIRCASNRLCLCIVESDRKTPNDDLGGTARAARAVHCRGNQPLCELLILEERAVENIIPTVMFQNALSSDNSRMLGVLFLENLESTAFAGARAYLDMKHGLKLGEIMHAPRNSHFVNYWMPVARALRGKAATVDPRCWATPRCDTSTDCCCALAPGLGESILEDVCEFLVCKSSAKKAEMVPNHLRPRWETIGQLVVAWCCGSLPMRAL